MQRGKIVTGPAHSMDVFPTCLDAAAAKHTASIAGHALQPLEGTSLLPALHGELASLAMHRTLFWERIGNEAMHQPTGSSCAPTAQPLK